MSDTKFKECVFFIAIDETEEWNCAGWSPLSMPEGPSHEDNLRYNALLSLVGNNKKAYRIAVKLPIPSHPTTSCCDIPQHPVAVE